MAYVNARRDVVRRIAYGLCGDWYRADDLTQTAFLKLYQAWDTIRNRAATDGFVRSCLVRANIDEFRRRGRREVVVEEIPESAPSDDDSLASGVVDRELIRKALDRVPVGQRTVLVLRFLDGLDVAETARQLGCSEGNVKSQTARGLVAMRSAMTELGAQATWGGG